MKALVCSELGDPTSGSGLQVVHHHASPEKSLRARDVRIKVVAASLNFADALQVQVASSFCAECFLPV